MRPRIIQGDDQIGFYWSTPTGSPTSLQALVAVDDEPDRLMATHLEALDDALIIAAGRFGEVLGGVGGHPPMPTNVTALSSCTEPSTGCASNSRRHRS